MGSLRIWEQITDTTDNGASLTFDRNYLSVDKLTEENFPELFQEDELIPGWLNGGWGAIPLSSK